MNGRENKDSENQAITKHEKENHDGKKIVFQRRK